MENQKKNVIPTPPKPPRIPEMPKMAGTGKMPAIPNVGFNGIKMVGVIKDKIWEHHIKFHLDANGELKPKFKEMGLKLMEKFKG